MKTDLFYSIPLKYTESQRLIARSVTAPAVPSVFFCVVCLLVYLIRRGRHYNHLITWLSYSPRSNQLILSGITALLFPDVDTRLFRHPLWSSAPRPQTLLSALIYFAWSTCSPRPCLTASTINPTNTGIRSHSAHYSFVNKTLIIFPSSLSAFGSWIKSVSNRNKTAGRKKKESCCPLALWAWGLLKVWRGRFHIQCLQRVNTLQHWRSWIICGGCYLVLWRQICFCLKWIIMLGTAVYSVPCHRLFIVITLCSLLEDGSLLKQDRKSVV